MTQDDSRSRLARHGYVIQHDFLTRSEVEVLRRAFEGLEQVGAPKSRQVLYTRRKAPPGRPGLDRLMDQWLYPLGRLESTATLTVLERLIALVSKLMGMPVIPFQDAALAKRPGHATFPWHQDLPFWPVDVREGAVSWLALDPMDAANGGLELAAGSHRSGIGPPIDLHTGEPQEGYDGGPVARPEVGHLPRLGPGDVVVFHACCWHRSGPNTSSGTRRAWSISWLPRVARWDFTDVPRHPVRGQVSEGEEVLPWSLSRYRLGPA